MKKLLITSQKINNEEINSVSARKLHEYLEINTRFDIWFNRMVEYGFVENTDYLLVVQKRATNNLKNPIKDFIDYVISIDMAKEIAMIQRSTKGKEARLYFIECERQLKEVKIQLLEKQKARDIARLEYKPMILVLKEHREALGKGTESIHYSNEANLIYLVVMGATAKQLKNEEDIENIRDTLTSLQIQAVQDIQKHNYTLIELGLGYKERKEKLNTIFNRKWAEKLLDEHIRIEA